MYNIYLLCTRHENLGQCNSQELYNIIQRINPDVIFEEMPPSYYDQYYVSKTKKNLESIAINAYSKDFNIKNIPVDSDDVPDNNFFEKLGKLHFRIERLSDENGYNYRNCTDLNIENAYNLGFEYLNSDRSSYYYKKIKESIENGLKSLNNKNFDSIYIDWVEITNKREDEMLKNIYNYSANNPFKCAVFTIGSGHRQSIIEKILNFSNTKEPKLNWKNVKKPIFIKLSDKSP